MPGPVLQFPHSTLAIRGVQQRVDIFVRDAAGVAVAADSIMLAALDQNETTLFAETWPTGAARIVAGTAVGDYFVLWGAGTNENTNAGDYLLRWTVTTGEGTTSAVQIVKVISPTTARLISYFRMHLDKALMPARDGTDGCGAPGWTDAQLLMILENGLTLINNYQPYPTWGALDAFPDIHRNLLLDAGVAAGVMSQQLYAIATDIDSYSDNGHAFVIIHNTKLGALYQQVAARLDALVPAFKKHYVVSGHVRTEVGPNFRLSLLLSVSPFGITLPNLFPPGA